MTHWIGTTSMTDAGMSEFKECLKKLRDGHPDEALLHVRSALSLSPKNPFYMSYTGLLAALAEERFADGEALCLEALDLRRNHAQLYLNLAEVYQRSGRKEDALATLEKGLVSSGRDFRLRRAIERIGMRRDPVLTFLHRCHPLNRTLGRLRHRVAGPVRAA